MSMCFDSVGIDRFGEGKGFRDLERSGFPEWFRFESVIVGVGGLIAFSIRLGVVELVEEGEVQGEASRVVGIVL